MRPLLGFARVMPRALETIRRVLDDDAEFRVRVASAVEEEAVGRAGWLFVARPEGWGAEFEGLVATEEAELAVAEDAAAERSARRRLARVQAAASRAAADAEEARAELAAARRALSDARQELVDERRQRNALDEALEESVRVAEATAREASEAMRQRDRAREDAAARAEELERLRGEHERVLGRLQAFEARAAEVDAPQPRSEPEEAEPRLAHVVAPLVADAARAAAEVARALDRVADALADGLTGDDPSSEGEPSAAGRTSAQAAPRERPQPRSSKRKPVPLPPAVFDDSPEAAEHLMRVPAMLVVVDGYNVSKLAWPEHTLSEQRRRLCDALEELGARTGVAPCVVFDGGDIGSRPAPSARALRVRVQFSPAGIEADDVILDFVRDLPVDQPVTVASSDRRVADGAVALGANVITSAQLLAVLRR